MVSYPFCRPNIAHQPPPLPPPQRPAHCRSDGFCIPTKTQQAWANAKPRGRAFFNARFPFFPQREPLWEHQFRVKKLTSRFTSPQVSSHPHNSCKPLPDQRKHEQLSPSFSLVNVCSFFSDTVPLTFFSFAQHFSFKTRPCLRAFDQKPIFGTFCVGVFLCRWNFGFSSD